MTDRVMLSLVAILTLLGALVAPAAAQPNSPPVMPNGPLLGVAYQDVDGEAVVTQVLPGSAASDAGLQEGDVITAVNSETVDASSVASTIGNYAPGDTITLTIRRDSETLDLEATLGTRNPEMDMMPGLPEQAFLGISLRADDVRGVVIGEVVSNSPAEAAGLQVDDVITAINDQAITTPQDAVEIIHAMNPGDTVSITVDRNGESVTVDAELGTQPGRAASVMRIGGDEVKYLKDQSAWEIDKVTDGDMLAAAGLQAGDVITAIDGEPFTPESLPDVMSMASPNSTVTLTVQRGDETLEIEAPGMIRLALLAASGDLMPGNGNMPFQFFDRRGLPHSGQPFEFNAPDNGQHPMPFGFHMPGPVRLGIAFVTLDENTAAQNGVDVTEGALVTMIIPDSPADDAGLQEGDIITAVDGDIVDAERTLADRIAAYEPGDTITLDVLRDGETLQLEVTLKDVDMSTYQFQSQPERPTEQPDA